MKVKDIVAILSKFFALYILCQGLFKSLPSVIFGFFTENIHFNNIAPIFVVFLCYLVIFLFFWSKSDWVAEKILGLKKENTIQTILKIQDIEKSGLIIIGVLLIAKSIPQLASILASFLIHQEQLHPIHVDRSLESAFSIAVGLVLIFGASGLSGIVKRVRSWPHH